jgi:hypothetical protein
MKKSVKVLMVAVFAFGTTFLAQAQDRTVTMSATAKVVDVLDVQKEQDLDFGIVMQGVNKMISVTAGVSDKDAGDDNVTGIKGGVFQVYAGAGSSVSLEVTVPSVLGGANSTTLPIVFNRDLDDAADQTTIGYGISSGSVTKLFTNQANSITFPSGVTDVIGTKSATRIFIGGVVKPSATQANGTYTGTITLVASYN